MSVQISNTNLNNSFDTWRLNTNLMATTISNNVVTVTRSGDAARGGAVKGDGHVSGTFSATTLKATTVKGGNTSASGWLIVGSNTHVNSASFSVTANSTFQGNVIIATAGAEVFNMGNISRMRMTGGSKGQYLRKTGTNTLDFEPLTLRQLTDLSSNSAHLILSGANTTFAEVAGQSPHLKFANANDAIELYMSGGAGGSGGSDLYLNLADASAASRLNIADSANAVVAYIDSDGNLYLADTLDVDGAVTLNGAVTLGDASTDTITVKGNFANQSTSGAAVFNGTSTFNGTTNMNGTLNLNGNVNVGDAAADVMTVTSTSNMNGNTTLGNSIADTLTVNSRVVSNLIANGSYNLGSSGLRWNTVYATAIDATSVSLSGDHTVGGQLNVTENIEVTGNTNVNGTLTANNAFKVKGATTLDGAVTLGDAQTDTITVKGKFANQSTIGTATFNGDVILGNATADTITMKGNFANQHTEGTATFGGNVGVGKQVTAGFDLETANSVKVGENLTVAGNTTVTGNMTVTGELTIPSDTIIAIANADFSNITVSEDATFGTDSSNTVVFNSSINSSITPKSATRQDLGSSSSKWHNVYANNVTVGDEMTVTNKLTVTKNVVVSGNLTVSGTTTTVNSETVNIADNIIKLNSNVSGITAPTEDAGIAVNRGSSANAELRWDEGNDYWKIHTGGTYTGRIVTTGDTASGGALANYYTVANTDAKFQTIATSKSYLANTNAYIASVQSDVDANESTERAALANTNTAIADRMQVANVVSYTAKYLEVANVSATDTSTLATWAALISTNTAIRTLVSDRMQVANVNVILANTNSYIATTAATELTHLANTNAYIASVQSDVDSNEATERAALANTNSYIASVSATERSALANTNSYIATTAATELTHLANTNAYIATKLNSSSYTTADVRSKAALANTNSYIATKIGNLSEDTTPQLGGNLDTNGNNITFGDSAVPGTDDTLTFGASGDLQIFHDGSDSYVQENGTGALALRGNNVAIRNISNENMILCQENAGVYLYYDNNAKLETETGGVKVHTGLGVGTSSSGTTGEIRATNNITAYYSDARLKNFLGTIDGALDKVKELNGYYFEENETAKSLGYDNDARQVGVSAQEVEAVLPEIVTDAPINGNVEGADYKTVYYDKLVPLLIEAIKELSDKVDELEGNK